MLSSILNPNSSSLNEPPVQSGKMAIESFNSISAFGPRKKKTDFNIKKMGSSAESTNSDSSSIHPRNLNRNVPNISVEANEKTLMESIVNQQTVQCTLKQILKSDYRNLLHEYENSDKKFTDQEFPPTNKSLGGRWLNQNTQWKRISQVIPDACFVKDKIAPSDILQGQIGDCYFLSALAALAEHDYRIKNIFASLQIQENGIYMARILHKGVLQEVVVDDFVPVNRSGELMFARPAGGTEIWVVILEKCWAKLYGSYSAIIGGLPHEVLHAFSGAPTIFNSMPRSAKLQDELFEEIYQADQDEAVLCCGTKGDPEIEKSGLVIGHAYTLLGVYKKPFKMVKIRNPWGEREWNGRASQKDLEFWRNVSKRDKALLGFSDKNDGIFFMLWQDFIKCFNMVDLCMIDDDASYLSVNGSFKKNQGRLYEFEIYEAGKVTISISQENSRSFKSQLQKKRGYSKTTLIFSKYDSEKKGYQFAFKRSSQYSHLPDHYMTFENLAPGKYMIYARCDWLSHEVNTATISAYSGERIFIREVEDSNPNFSPELFLYQVFMDHARRNTKNHKFLKKDKSQWMCSDFLLDKCGFGYTAYHLSDNSKQKIGIELDESQYQRNYMNLLRPYGGNGKIKTVVNPGQEMIILYQVDPYKGTSFTIPVPKAWKLM